jgi:hypothetical protein
MLGPEDDTGIEAVIRLARNDVSAYHADLERDAGRARVALRGAPHLLVPSGVIARDLPRILEQGRGRGGSADAMYRFGCQIGRSHAAAFLAGHRSDPLYRLLTGPFHFAWAGYGDVDLLILEAHLDDRFAILSA